MNQKKWTNIVLDSNRIQFQSCRIPRNRIEFQENKARSSWFKDVTPTAKQTNKGLHLRSRDISPVADHVPNTISFDCSDLQEERCNGNDGCGREWRTGGIGGKKRESGEETKGE